MKRSEIFESFVKIAQEKGLVSNDSSEAKKKLEQTGRAGSDDISTIEALYGVKPEAAKGLDYKNNIMEAAHPNSVVVSPSYDKLHGLVESEIERQNINLHIVNKPVNGLSTQHKYAEKELILSLVRIGNDLDNRGSEELRVLADTCLEQMSPLKKKAWVAPVLVGAALLIGAIWANEHLPNVSKGLEIDYQRLDKALAKFETANTNWGVGHEYDQELKNDVAGFRSNLKSIMDAYRKNNEAFRYLEKPRNVDEFKSLLKQPKTQEILKAYQQIKQLVDKASTYIEQMEENFNSDMYKSRHTKNTGVVTNVLESLHLEGDSFSLTADDFKDVLVAIPAFKKSLNAAMNVLAKAGEFEKKVEAAEARAQSQPNTPDLPSQSTQEPTASNKPGQSVQDLDNQVDTLNKGIDAFKGLMGT